MSIYNLDNLISFNSKLEDYFVNNTTNTINNLYESFLSKNINRLKKKDKTILKDVSNLSINFALIDNLNFLWNESFNDKQNNYSLESLVLFSSDKKQTKTLKKEDRRIAKDIRQRDIDERRKTTKILKQDLITSDFGQTYLQQRNKQIAKNFTNTYQQKIFDSINNYFNQNLSITREKNLINHLSFKRINQLSPEEKLEYINEYTKLAEIYGLRTSSLDTYDSLKFNPKERIRRIAKTELSAAYNLGRYDELVKQGYTEFQIKNTRKNSTCELCISKHNEIITLEQIARIPDKGFTDFKGIDTRKDKNAYENRNLIFPIFHPGCFCSLIGFKKTKSINKLQQLTNLASNANTAITALSTTAGLSERYLNIRAIKQQQDEDLLKVIIASGSIMSIGMMYYFFTKTNLGANAIKTIAKKTTNITNNTIGVIDSNIKDTLKDRLQQAVLDKDLTTTTLNEVGYKPPTNETLSQYLSKQQKDVINNQLTTTIKDNITKPELQKLLRTETILINAQGITKLRTLGKTDLEQAKFEELELLINTLLVNNKTTSKVKLVDLIYKEPTQLSSLKLPLNIKDPDLNLIKVTENKLISSTNKLEKLGVNITKLNNEVKKNKSSYLNDIETLRELDSQLTEELVGIERLNSEYINLLETTNDTNLKKYLTNKIDINNQSTSDLRTKLNNIGADLYGTKLANVDPDLKSQLIKNINDKGKDYLEFKNTRNSKVSSIIKKLDNAKKSIDIKDLNIDYIDTKLEELGVIERDLKTLDKNSLVLDNVLSDYAILNKIDTNIDTKDLGYTFNEYLGNSKKRTSQVINVDDFRQTSLTNTKTSLDNYKKKLIQAKYKLLNNEPINEFKLSVSKFNKPKCHIKLKNIIEKLRRD